MGPAGLTTRWACLPSSTFVWAPFVWGQCVLTAASAQPSLSFAKFRRQNNRRFHASREIVVICRWKLHGQLSSLCIIDASLKLALATPPHATSPFSGTRLCSTNATTRRHITRSGGREASWTFASVDSGSRFESCKRSFGVCVVASSAHTPFLLAQSYSQAHTAFTSLLRSFAFELVSRAKNRETRRWQQRLRRPTYRP